METAAQELDNTTFVNVDDLSKIKDATPFIKERLKCQKAKAIINEQIFEFLEWLFEMRKNVPLENL